MISRIAHHSDGNVQLTFVVTAALLYVVGCRPAEPSRQDTNMTDTNMSYIVPAASDKSRDAAEQPTAVQSEPNIIEDEQLAALVGEEESRVEGTKHRILLFPPDGPLLIEFDIAVADRPLNGWIDTMLDEAFDLADSDQDGRVTWDELYESDELESRYFSESSVLDRGLDETKQQYDLNKNDLVDRYELPKLLTGGMGSGQSFGLRGSNYYREVNRYASPVFRHLDRDRSGSLSSDEIRDSSARLRARDFDNDEFVTISDLPLGDVNDGETRNNAFQPHVAVWLGPRNPWDAIRLALVELYGEGDALSAEDLTLTPELFPQLDTDRNDRLSLGELSQLTEITPHVAINVRLSSHDKNTQVLSNAMLCDSLRRANVQIHMDSHWLKLELPASRVDLFVRDTPLETAIERAAELLEQVDVDGNHYVDSQEYDAADVEWESEFAELDADGNEMIFVDEFASLFPTAEDLVGGQVRVQVSHRPDALFSSLDANGDSRLAPQELDAVEAVMTPMDTDNDGLLTPDELPDYLVIGLTQGGDRQTDELLAQPPVVTNRIPPATPEWFQAMDHNADGQLSPREFLGTTAQFEQRDTDADGYLNIDEAVR